MRRDVLEQGGAAGILESGVCGRKVRSDVAEVGRTQEGVHDGVGESIPVAVAEQPLGEGDVDSPQQEGAPLHQPVRIVANADAHG